MFSWIKGIFSSPKTFVKMAVDALDMAVPFLSSEIEKVDKKFAEMNSSQKAQLVVDKVQEYLRKQFKLDA